MTPGTRATARRDALVRRHIGIYAYTRDALSRWVTLPPHPLELVERLEQLRPLGSGAVMGVAVVAEAPPPGIDTEADLARAEAFWPEWVARADVRTASSDPEARSGAPQTSPA